MIRRKTGWIAAAAQPGVSQTKMIEVHEWALLRIHALDARYTRPKSDAGFMAEIVAVHLYAGWQRYAEDRLVEALINHPQQFLLQNRISNLKRIPRALAAVLVRGGERYFDFRSTEDLVRKGDRFVGQAANPFRRLPKSLQSELDCLGALRNRIVHYSESARKAYKKRTMEIYGLKRERYVEGFLTSIDRRSNSRARGKERITGLMEVVRQAVNATA